MEQHDDPSRDPADAAHEAARLDSHPGDGVARGTARMEAYADAVFAIAFTLPVVEIALPQGHDHLSRQLSALWPEYLGYGIASLVIGIYWVHHHFTGAIYRTTGHYFNLATVLFLAAIGFVAFPARVFAEHVADLAAVAAAANFFTCSLSVTGVSWLFKWTVGRISGHVDARLDPAYVMRLDAMYWRSTIVLVAAAALGFAWWPAGLALAAAATLRYLVPPETPVFQREAPTVEGEA